VECWDDRLVVKEEVLMERKNSPTEKETLEGDDPKTTLSLSRDRASAGGSYTFEKKKMIPALSSLTKDYKQAPRD